MDFPEFWKSQSHFKIIIKNNCQIETRIKQYFLKIKQNVISIEEVAPYVGFVRPWIFRGTGKTFISYSKNICLGYLERKLEIIKMKETTRADNYAKAINKFYTLTREYHKQVFFNFP